MFQRKAFELFFHRRVKVLSLIFLITVFTFTMSEESFLYHLNLMTVKATTPNEAFEATKRTFRRPHSLPEKQPERGKSFTALLLRLPLATLQRKRLSLLRELLEQVDVPLEIPQCRLTGFPTTKKEGKKLSWY